MKFGLYSIYVLGNFKFNLNEGFNFESFNKYGVLKKLFLLKN